ncbi:POTRA domain-containing protein [Terriglobus sp. 2YAB30_2]|uniref:POTRA domain-containing protein n=1 Tax=unclassified Terriglobus TaxID=2628988 RepID=UPI003F95E648
MRSLIRITALLFAVSAAANAQYTIKKIVFDGQNPYTQTELEAASGLKPGQTLNNQTLQAAAQRLVDTGAFDDMQATLDGPMKAISVIFKVKPVDTAKLLHISYANFAWWSPEELKAEISRRVPLGGETIPEAGSLQASVQTALEAMLQEKGLTGAKVSEEVLEPRPGVPFRVAAFRIVSPAVVISSVRVDGVSPAMQTNVQKMTTALAGRPYNEGVGGQDISATLLAIFRDAGYLTAKLTPLQRTISGTGPVQVSLSTTVQEGEAYKLGVVSWTGAPWMTEQQFVAGAKLQHGSVASQRALQSALAVIQNSYRQHGYLDITVDAPPVLDDATHTANFTVQVTPGEIYRLQEVRVTGLTPAQRNVWDQDWKLKPGDVYDAGALGEFLKWHIANELFQGASSAFKQTVDPTSKTVVLEVSFKKMGA